MGKTLSKKATKISPHDRDILKVKCMRDTVKTYQKKVEQSLQFEQDLALQLVQRGNRDKAKCILRKRLVLQNHLHRTDQQLAALEEMVHNLEATHLQNKILDGLKAGNRALKRAQEVLKIKNVEAILEETLEGIEKQEEINQLLNSLRIEEASEEELEKELDLLIEQFATTVVYSKKPVEIPFEKKDSLEWLKPWKKNKVILTDEPGPSYVKNSGTKSKKETTIGCDDVYRPKNVGVRSL